ncbi:MAG: hypothetical protein IPJ39_05710 [Saprospiraceae bacterium]|nr:hypothetical protein [Saprospiraceae bacterium]
MNKHYTILVLIWTFVSMNVKAQSISFSIGDELSICQQTSLNINIKNTTDVELKPSELTIKMPCGTTYITGSVTAAVEKSVNDPSLPVFTEKNTQTSEFDYQNANKTQLRSTKMFGCTAKSSF